MPQETELKIKITKPLTTARHSPMSNFTVSIPEFGIEASGRGLSSALRGLGHKIYVTRGSLVAAGDKMLNEEGKALLAKLQATLGAGTADDDDGDED